MNSQLIKMIATDIDGTMLRSDHTLSNRVRRSLWSAKEAGIHVVPATGRPFVMAQDVITSLGLRDYWVLANGAITYHVEQDQIVRGFWIGEVVVRKLVENLRAEIPGIQFTIELERSSVFEPNFGRVIPEAARPYLASSVEDVLAHLDGPIQKVLAFQPDLELDFLFSRICTVIGERAVASYSGMRFIELSASQVTKAHALAGLADSLGVQRHEVAAFGDNHNDIPMLEWAGQSYAMDNGTDDAKQAAQTVIAPNDLDGLALEVDRLVAENAQAR